MKNLFRWLNKYPAKTYQGSGWVEPFTLTAYQRSRALAYILKGNVLGALRFLYKAGFMRDQARYFISEETGVLYHATQVLHDWKYDVPDSKQLHIAQRLEAVNRILVEWGQKSSAEKSASENSQPTDGNLA